MEKIKELKRINDEKEREILKEFSEYEIDLKDISSNNHSTIQQSQHIHIGHRKRNPLTKLKSKLDKVETTRRRKQQKWNDNQNVRKIKSKYQNTSELKPILSASPFGGYKIHQSEKSRKI
uniref:Uncharacterized protein n=1 Tax=Meloidogyne enterolobii TaxID=390850 RepID=A0A6V7VRM6_MELEN|nr:unnamed protein product [Meloidogyne enterolobii]